VRSHAERGNEDFGRFDEGLHKDISPVVVPGWEQTASAIFAPVGLVRNKNAVEQASKHGRPRPANGDTQ
jgi:hypothetical protein